VVFQAIDKEVCNAGPGHPSVGDFGKMLENSIRDFILD